MSKRNKLIGRFLSKPKKFKYREAVTLLGYYNYSVFNKGKTSGSRVSFVENKTKHIISIHKPHASGDPLKPYVLDQIEKALLSSGKFFSEKPKVEKIKEK